MATSPRSRGMKNTRKNNKTFLEKWGTRSQRAAGDKRMSEIESKKAKPNTAAAKPKAAAAKPKAAAPKPAAAKSKVSKFGVGTSKTVTHNGKEMANVTAEQLKGSGLSLRAYMNQWNKTGNRPK